MKTEKAAHINCKRQFLQGRVVALAERLQDAEGDEALLIVDQLLETGRQLLEVAGGRHE